MSPLRYRDDESSSTGTILGVLVGAVAGFAVGMLVAQRVGGFSGLTSKLRSATARGKGAAQPTARGEAAAGGLDDDEEFEDIEEDEIESEAYDEGLEERVLEAFRNDPILAERAVDIGSIGDATIELAGWVEDESEAKHAVTIAGGVPGVDTVVNRIAIGDEERRFEEAARRVRDGDPSLTEAHWDRGGVGTGRRRQGTSDEPDRHEDPKVVLENRWQGAEQAVRDAADDMEGLAERRARAKKSVRAGSGGGSGASVSPAGIPKGDHVSSPLTADTGHAKTEPHDRI